MLPVGIIYFPYQTANYAIVCFDVYSLSGFRIFVSSLSGLSHACMPMTNASPIAGLACDRRCHNRFTVISRIVTFPGGFSPERRFPDGHFPGEDVSRYVT